MLIRSFRFAHLITDAKASLAYCTVDTDDLDDQRTRLALLAFGGVAIAILLVVSAINYAKESGTLVTVTLGVAVVLAGCLTHLQLTGRSSPVKHTYCLLMLMLSYVLLYTGGVRGNGHLWVFIFPPVCYFLMGLRCGSFYFVGVLGVAATVLFSPWVREAYPYGSAFGVRFLLAMFGVGAISFWYEAIRQRMHHALLESIRLAEWQAKHDELTGLLNRRGGAPVLDHYRHVCERRTEPCSVMMVDIDHFKKINDTYGHALGDEVLHRIGHTLRLATRAQDVGIRWGGEEFLFLLPSTPLEGASIVAANVLDKISSQLFETESGPCRVTCSIGLAQHGENETLDQTIARADLLLYEAKGAGRNCCMA